MNAYNLCHFLLFTMDFKNNKRTILHCIMRRHIGVSYCAAFDHVSNDEESKNVRLCCS